MTTVNLDSSALTSALEQLRLKLLDLTGRNRLINFKHTAGKSLQFIEGHPAAIYQRLVEANNKASISILGLPEPSRGDWVERNGRLQRPEPREWAKSQGISTSYDIPGVGESSDESNVRSLMYPDDLNRPGSTRHSRAAGSDVFRIPSGIPPRRYCGVVWGCRTSRCS